MDTENVSQMVSLLTSHGYLFILFAMVLEGPVVTIAAAFAAALGYFHPMLVLTLSVMGDLIGDLLYYFLGRLGRTHIVEKYGKKFGLNKEKVEKMEKMLHKNTWQTLSAIKIAPALSTFGLILAGAANIPFRKYINICLYITLPRSILFVVLGYYAGKANALADKYLHHSQYALFWIVIGIILINYIYKKISQIISQKIEDF